MEYSNELYHHGVKGMKWGIRKAVKKTSHTVGRMSRSMVAANLENRRTSLERTIARNKSLQKRYNFDYRKQNARYRAKMKRLNAMRNRKISDLSEAEIDRGRQAYKTMKNITLSVAITAASAAAGTISAPAAIATKLAGSAVSAAVREQD